MTGGNKNLRIVMLLILAGATMVAVAYASVPLYRLFCVATGYNGTTQRAETAPVKAAQPAERWVTVNFDANVDQKLPWEFKSDIHSLKVKLGDTYNVKFHAKNLGDKTVTGMATFNVQPDKAGSFFNKIQCFCFDKQSLKPNETAEFDVEFYVDPAMVTDKDAFDVQDITLSYTFFRAKDQTPKISAQPKTSGKAS